MLKDKTLRGVLFGANSQLSSKGLKSRIQTITMPALNGEPYRNYEWGRDDGFVMVLIRMIEKLEKRVSELESSKKK